MTTTLDILAFATPADFRLAMMQAGDTGFDITALGCLLDSEQDRVGYQLRCSSWVQAVEEQDPDGRLDPDQAWTAACAYDAMRDDLEEDLGERPRITTVEDVLEGIAQSDAWWQAQAGSV